MTEVNPKTALGYTWFNSCPPGGDDGPIVDPGLPITEAPNGNEEFPMSDLAKKKVSRWRGIWK